MSFHFKFKLNQINFNSILCMHFNIYVSFYFGSAEHLQGLVLLGSNFGKLCFRSCILVELVFEIFRSLLFTYHVTVLLLHPT